MEIKQLQTFWVLAQELSFTKTALKLNYAQSSVSAQIQGLEAEFGTLLFERIGKRITLTQSGVRLKRYAGEILRLVDETLIAVPDVCEPSGAITIGAVESLCTYRLSPILGQYRSLYPKVELIFRTGICSDLRKEVSNGSLDTALTLEPIVSLDTLVCEPLLREPMLVVTQPNHPLVHYKQVRPMDLEGETILVTEPGCSYRVMFERILAEAGIKNPMKIEFASLEAIKQCAMAGLGIAVLPEVAVVKEIEHQQLIPLHWDGPEFKIVTQMWWHKDKWISPALSAFLEMTKQFIVKP
ncbi:MAG TPA: LysR family transcriptional regulator [Bacillota bacterium]|nr:LysR family transcriptional regulator [Bacillota bacterium]